MTRQRERRRPSSQTRQPIQKLLRIHAECSPLHMPEAKAMLRVRGQDRESHDRLLIWEPSPTRLRSLRPHHAPHRAGSRRPFPAAASRSGHVSRAAKPRGPDGCRFLRIFRMQAPPCQDPCSLAWRESRGRTFVWGTLPAGSCPPQGHGAPHVQAREAFPNLALPSGSQACRGARPGPEKVLCPHELQRAGLIHGGGGHTRCRGGCAGED